jgi:hypothetical protein
MLLAVVLIVAAALSRIASVWEPSLANFAPLMALAFCGGVYFRDRRMWLIPFAALVLSDVFLDHYYQVRFGYQWPLSAAVLRALCFALATGLGWLVSQRKNWLNLFSGSLGGAVVFYLVTNSHAWWYDLSYSKSAAGWWQALTVGHPEYPPTLYFFRNSLASDLLFTGAFVLVMEYQALRQNHSSLLTRNARA